MTSNIKIFSQEIIIGKLKAKHCVSTGQNRKDLELNIKEVIELYLEVMKEESYPLSKPLANSAYL